MKEYRDYDLLRPFDLEKAKRGDLIFHCVLENEAPYEYVAGPDARDEYILKIVNSGSKNNGAFTPLFKGADLRMYPLGWVEGYSVYKGDILYTKHPMPLINELIIDALWPGVGLHAKDMRNAIPFDLLTWINPANRIKKEGFICVMKDAVTPIGNRDILPGRIVRHPMIFTSSDAAKAWANSCAIGDLIIILPISWEETIG